MEANIIEKIEKEFEEKFAGDDSNWETNGSDRRWIKNDCFISFLRSSLLSALKEQRDLLVEKVREKVIYCSEDTSKSVINMHGYNTALNEVISLLEEKIEK